eukprot:gene51575-69016_t
MSAGSISGTDTERCEPAWSFRLWDGAVIMANYLESILCNEIRGKIIVELGAGTGLVSIVAARLGASTVVVTDLPHAIPLLRHNINQNFTNESKNISDSPVNSNEIYIATCTSNHPLQRQLADCEGYMCNICDDEIDEDAALYRCMECNFDICSTCNQTVTSGQHTELPTWYRLLIQNSNSHISHTTNTNDNNTEAMKLMTLDDATTSTISATDVHTEYLSYPNNNVNHQIITSSPSSSLSLISSSSNDLVESNTNIDTNTPQITPTQFILHVYNWSDSNAPFSLLQ